MKIAFCSKGNFSLEKGFTKNRIELAECLARRGWETVLVDKKLLGIPQEQRYNSSRHSLALKEYLLDNDGMFDVVLYEYDTLPFDRANFSKSTLFVARPAILAYHFEHINFKYDLKTRLSHLKEQIKRMLMRPMTPGKYDHLERITTSLSNADVIQVQNDKDRKLLISRGYSQNKIIIVPNGVTAERIRDFDQISHSYNAPYKIAFVGTFDYRKGAIDFPKIFERILRYKPGTKLKLLGTRGMFNSEADVLRFFPSQQRSLIEVIPSFLSQDLPNLLQDCHVGLFPSYLESFGYGALEMMAAGLPVVSYDAPGPSDFIEDEFLAPTGDYKLLADNLIRLLTDKNLLKKKSEEVRLKVFNNYCWDDIAEKVDFKYRVFLDEMRSGLSKKHELLFEEHERKINTV